MKKIILSIGLCLCMGFAAVAQEEIDQPENTAAVLSKRGIPLLPEAGDFALGVDATPFLQYAGNFFGKSASNSAPNFKSADGVTIYGKYFLENDRAIRAKLNLGFGTETYKGVVTNDAEVANNPLNPDVTVVDVLKDKHTGINLNIGYEFRRGRGRVQGFYGAEALFGFSGGKETYSYANPMTALNRAPSTWDFVNDVQSNSASRVTERKNGNTVSVGVAGFVGVEYFFAPQLSIGGEFNLGFVYAKTGQSEATSETWNANANRVDTHANRNGSWGSTGFAGETSLYTKPSGSIFLMFHF